YELEGRGPGPTQIFLPPGFPETGSCNHGKSGLACFVVATEGRWNGLQLNGGGNFNAPNMGATSNLLEVDGPASLEYFTCVNFASEAASAETSVGVAAYLWTQLLQVNISGCGSYALASNLSSSVTAIRLSVDNIYKAGFNGLALADYYTQTVSQFDKYN